MPLRKDKVDRFRKLLLTRRQKLAEDLRLATVELINDQSVYTDSVDQAAAETDKNMTFHIKNRERTILWQIDAAIKRLEDGTFGDCERCEESIAEGRIEANPYTTLCIECKAELESEEHRFSLRA